MSFILLQIHLITGTACEFQGTDVFMMEYIDHDAISQDTYMIQPANETPL